VLRVAQERKAFRARRDEHVSRLVCVFVNCHVYSVPFIAYEVFASSSKPKGYYLIFPSYLSLPSLSLSHSLSLSLSLSLTLSLLSQIFAAAVGDGDEGVVLERVSGSGRGLQQCWHTQRPIHAHDQHFICFFAYLELMHENNNIIERRESEKRREGRGIVNIILLNIVVMIRIQKHGWRGLRDQCRQRNSSILAQIQVDWLPFR
jgi:hypothetical protein